MTTGAHPIAVNPVTGALTYDESVLEDADAVLQTLSNAKGDLIVATGADVFTRLAVGANDTALVADSAQATGAKWAVPTDTTKLPLAGGTMTGQLDVNINTGLKVRSGATDGGTIGQFNTNSWQWNPLSAPGAIFRINAQLEVESSDFKINTVGRGRFMAEGANAKSGVSTLIAGTLVVANTSVTATSRIQLTSQADGGTPGFLRVSTRTPGTSFTILSSDAADTSLVAWEMTEVI